MTKYKICPDCQHRNEPFRIECIQCEADLTSIPVVDEEIEQKRSESSVQKRIVRICDCGTVNLPAERKCSVCGEDISDITPTEQQEEIQNKGQVHFTFTAIDGAYAYEITHQEITIGRENEMSDYLYRKPYVSRVHAKLTIHDSKLFVTDLNSANHTYINNEQIVEQMELHDGDELALGGRVINNSRQANAAYFIVRICM